MKKNALLTILMIIFVVDIYGQETYQILKSAGFAVKCDCRLNVNSVFIEMAEQQGMSNVIASYICTENEGNPDLLMIYNINIYDDSKLFKNGALSFSQIEKAYLEQYAENLSAAGISYSYVSYQGVSAIRYTFEQFGVLPTRAIFFLKNRKSYLLQVGTKNNLTTKFNSLLSNFVIL